MLIKKIFILLLILSLSFSVYAVRYKSNATPIIKTGGGTAYVETILMATYSSCNIQITNTGELSHSLTYIVIGYAHPDAAQGITLISGVLEDDELADINISRAYHSIKVFVSETSEGNSTTFELNYTVKGV
jgi:hypothetical protein